MPRNVIFLWWVVVCLVLVIPSAESQITFQDIRASYLENRNSFENANLELKWTLSNSFPAGKSRFSQAYEAYSQAVIKSNEQAKARGETFGASYDIELLKMSYPEFTRYHVFHSPSGCRIRTCGDHRFNWVDGWAPFDVGAKSDFNVFTAVKGDSFVSLAATRFEENKQTRRYYVLPENSAELGVSSVYSPVSLSFGDYKPSPLFCILDFAFIDQPSPRRDIKIREKGEVVEVVIEDDLSQDGSTGVSVTLELLVRKNFLPRRLTWITSYNQGGQVFPIQKQRRKMEIEAEISFLEGVGYYPSRYTMKQNDWFPKAGDVDLILENKDFELGEDRLIRPDEDILCRWELVCQVESISQFDPQVIGVFELAVPPEADVVVDQKSK